MAFGHTVQENKLASHYLPMIPGKRMELKIRMKMAKMGKTEILGQKHGRRETYSHHEYNPEKRNHAQRETSLYQ